jgi:1-deoxy-D-xylulose-5-phosphate synthase
VEDGATHHGLFDIAYLRAMPNTTLLAPANAEELEAMLDFALAHAGPVAIRYARDEAPAAGGPIEPIELGRGVLLRDGRDVVLVAYGTQVPVALGAARLLAEHGVEAAVVNARFAKPLDTPLIARSLARRRLLVTLEEHAVGGGFGAAVLEGLCAAGVALPPTLLLGVPDRFVEHGSRGKLLERVGLTPQAVTERILRAVGSPRLEPATGR